MSANAKRLPRRKPIDYTIMREAPFYDGMLLPEEKEIVRDFRELYELVLTAHYVRNLYVGAVWGVGNINGTRVVNVDMVTPEGFIVMNIRAIKSGSTTKVGINVGPGFPDPVSTSFRSLTTERLSVAVSHIAHGVRRRSHYSDPFDAYLSDEHEVDSLKKIERPNTRIDAVTSRMADRLIANYDLKPQYIDLNPTETTWSALCAAGHASMLDVPSTVRSSIAKAAETYTDACTKIEETLSKVREGLCRKKLLIGHGMYMSNTNKTDRNYGPDNNNPLIIATADFTPMYETIVSYIKNSTSLSDCALKFDTPPRLYRSFNKLPEDLKARIAPKMIPVNLRKGVSPADWSTNMFPDEHNSLGTEYIDEIETMIHRRDHNTISWYVVNY